MLWLEASVFQDLFFSYFLHTLQVYSMGLNLGVWVSCKPEIMPRQGEFWCIQEFKSDLSFFDIHGNDRWVLTWNTSPHSVIIVSMSWDSYIHPRELSFNVWEVKSSLSVWKIAWVGMKTRLTWRNRAAVCVASGVSGRYLTPAWFLQLARLSWESIWRMHKDTLNDCLPWLVACKAYKDPDRACSVELDLWFQFVKLVHSLWEVLFDKQCI